MTNWKALVAAQELDISDDELERIRPVLDALKSAFDPLVASIPLEIEPATVFRCEPEEEGMK